MRNFTFNEYKFSLGQSAKENWELLDLAKTENSDFIWFHLESFPSPYVIMHTPLSDLKKPFSLNKYILYGANMCKSYSKYKNMKDIKIMYMPVKKVNKTSIIGEVEITGKYNTITP